MTQPTLDDLFAKAGVEREAPQKASMQVAIQAAAELNHRRGRAKAYRFAILFIKNHFNPKAAYAEFMAGLGQRPGSNKNWAHQYASNKTVLAHVRRILEDAMVRAREQADDRVGEMLAINDILIRGDVTELLEQRREYRLDDEGNPLPGTGRIVTYLKPIEHLTRAQRMLIHKIRFKDGELAGIEAYNRLDAERAQLAVLELAHRTGGSDEDWIGDFKQRITKARQRRIDEEVKNGKVIRLAEKVQHGL